MLANVYNVFIHRGRGEIFHFIFMSKGKENAFPIYLSSMYF